MFKQFADTQQRAADLLGSAMRRVQQQKPTTLPNDSKNKVKSDDIDAKGLGTAYSQGAIASASTAGEVQDIAATSALEATAASLVATAGSSSDDESAPTSSWELLNRIMQTGKQVGPIDPVALFIGWAYLLAHPDAELKAAARKSEFKDVAGTSTSNASVASMLAASCGGEESASSAAEQCNDSSHPVAVVPITGPALTGASASPSSAIVSREVARCVHFAAAAYQPSVPKFLACIAESSNGSIKITEADIVYAQCDTGAFVPAYYLFVDHEDKSIVLAMRGTASLADLATDMAGAPIAFSGGHAHTGIVTGVIAFLSDAHWAAGAAAKSKLNGKPIFSKEEVTMVTAPPGDGACSGQESKEVADDSAGAADGNDANAASNDACCARPARKGAASSWFPTLPPPPWAPKPSAASADASEGKREAELAGSAGGPGDATTARDDTSAEAAAAAMSDGAGGLTGITAAASAVSSTKTGQPAGVLMSLAAAGLTAGKPSSGATLKPGEHYGPYLGSSGIAGILQRLIDLLPGYTVILTGHSLGGGTAALLATKLRRMLGFPHSKSRDSAFAPTAASEGKGSDDDAVDGRQAPAAVTVDQSSASATRAQAAATSALLPPAPVYCVGYGMPAAVSPHLSALLALTDAQLAAFAGVEYRPVTASRSHLPVVTSVVCHHDFVARLSLRAVKLLHARMNDPELSKAAWAYAKTKAVEEGYQKPIAWMQGQKLAFAASLKELPGTLQQRLGPGSPADLKVRQVIADAQTAAAAPPSKLGAIAGFRSTAQEAAVAAGYGAVTLAAAATGFLPAAAALAVAGAGVGIATAAIEKRGLPFPRLAGGLGGSSADPRPGSAAAVALALAAAGLATKAAASDSKADTAGASTVVIEAAAGTSTGVSIEGDGFEIRSEMSEVALAISAADAGGVTAAGDDAAASNDAASNSDATAPSMSLAIDSLPKHGHLLSIARSVSLASALGGGGAFTSGSSSDAGDAGAIANADDETIDVAAGLRAEADAAASEAGTALSPRLSSPMSAMSFSGDAAHSSPAADAGRLPVPASAARPGFESIQEFSASWASAHCDDGQELVPPGRIIYITRNKAEVAAAAAAAASAEGSKTTEAAGNESTDSSSPSISSPAPKRLKEPSTPIPEAAAASATPVAAGVAASNPPAATDAAVATYAASIVGPSVLSCILVSPSFWDDHDRTSYLACVAAVAAR